MDQSHADIEGQPHPCSPEELFEAIDLVDSIMRADGKRTVLKDYPLVYASENLTNLRVLRMDGRIVAEVPFIARPIEHQGCRLTIGIISPTCTDPHYRRRGYALACLNSCLACMHQAGVELSVLWTLVPTFRFYERAGY